MGYSAQKAAAAKKRGRRNNTAATPAAKATAATTVLSNHTSAISPIDVATHGMEQHLKALRAITPRDRHATTEELVQVIPHYEGVVKHMQAMQQAFRDMRPRNLSAADLVEYNAYLATTAAKEAEMRANVERLRKELAARLEKEGEQGGSAGSSDEGRILELE
ncbi:hypothetical protein H9P43_006792 [Blastocladiella emersonii ATCC 22665]|nr:hypothetical protein H9P43_006792 [Blastocladiella emersonii ATCC 22665]